MQKLSSKYNAHWCPYKERHQRFGPTQILDCMWCFRGTVLNHLVFVSSDFTGFAFVIVVSAAVAVVFVAAAAASTDASTDVDVVSAIAVVVAVVLY